MKIKPGMEVWGRDYLDNSTDLRLWGYVEQATAKRFTCRSRLNYLRFNLQPDGSWRNTNGVVKEHFEFKEPQNESV